MSLEPLAALQAIEAILRETAAEQIMPRRPGRGEAQAFVEPWRAEVVTEADTAAELVLTRRLRDLEELPVVGEEAAKQDDALMALSRSEARHWLVDPIDGTNAFASGRDGFGTMVALVDRGHTRLAAIYRPVDGVMMTAALGEGAWHAGRRLSCGGEAPVDAVKPTKIGGTVYTSFFDEVTNAKAQACAAVFDIKRSAPDYAACVEYPSLVLGQKDFALYGRLRPWDHAPGCLIVREAGGVTRVVRDRGQYRPAMAMTPMLAARDEAVWQVAAQVLRPAFEAG